MTMHPDYGNSDRRGFIIGQESYTVSCAVPPETVIDIIVSGQVSPAPIEAVIAQAQELNIHLEESDECEGSSELSNLNKIYETFESQYFRIQNLQESIDHRNNVIQVLEDRNSYLGNEIRTRLEVGHQQLTDYCQAHDRRPFDIRPSGCEDIPPSPPSFSVSGGGLSSPSPADLRRILALELVQFSSDLLQDTVLISRMREEIEVTVDELRELVSEEDSNDSFIEENKNGVDSEKEEIETIARLAYSKFTTDIQGRFPGVSDYTLDPEVSAGHNAFSIMQYILEETKGEIQDLRSRLGCSEQNADSRYSVSLDAEVGI